MSVHKLTESTRSLMRSSFILTDLNSIVDELIANALDANSTQIVITLNLDTYCLTIQDNGDGITYQNMHKIAQRHHTSKDVPNDMRGITSLGYKGEALASLAQISMIEIISKNKFDHQTCSKMIRGGKLINIKNNLHNETRCHSKHGTTIIVKDMFFNLKIRREQIFGKIEKRTKSNATFKKSAAKLQSNLVKWCIAHYDIKFTLNNTNYKKQNKTIFKSKSYSSPKFILSEMIDPDLIQYLHEFDSDCLLNNNQNISINDNNNDDLRIWGFVCDVRRLYHKKDWQLVFINKRHIQHKRIEKQIVEILMNIYRALKSDLEIDTDSNVPWYQHKQNQHHQHPIFTVFIETNPENVLV